MDNTHIKGQLTEMRCMQDFTSQNCQCSIPYGTDCKYDLIVDVNGKLFKIQCKTSRWSTDTAEENVAFEFSTRIATINTKKVTYYRYSNCDVDFFYTTFLNQGYLIPQSEANGANFRMRFEYPKSGHKTLIHLEKDYRIESVIQKIKEQY